jgi:3-oxoacyl-[acyl-carrier protein] reductase
VVGEGSSDTISRAAQCIAHLCSPESGGITGRLISAVWDPWQDLAAHTEEIARSDIYTLRRITPKDRGLAWGDVED